MAIAAEAALVERVPTRLYIDGNWLETPTTLAVEDPSTGETLAEVDVGPLIDSVERDKVAALVDDARNGGATALTGGEFGPGTGWFYEPTVLVDVPDDGRVLGEEIFGPVAPLRSFSDEDEAIAAANATEYGLVAYFYTNDLRRAMRVSEQLETGMLGINQGIVSNAAAPFGGAKHSGFGREGGREGIEEYLETRYLAIAR